MFRKLLAMVGIRGAGSKQFAEGLHRPYSESQVNFLYNLLFCDDISLFNRGESREGPWGILFAEPADRVALRKLSEDRTEESRVRALAFNRLRSLGHFVPPKELLGVIVEVPQPKGLDVLAAYSDGRVRYLNQSGKVAIFEGAPEQVETGARTLVTHSQAVVDQIGPWEKKRLPPPRKGIMRMTFLVSDGLYFGQGPFELLGADPKGGPVLAQATRLLTLVVDAGLKHQATDPKSMV